MEKHTNIELLTAIRKLGLTQRQVADKIGVDESRVSVWISNKSVKPHAKYREALERIGIKAYDK